MVLDRIPFALDTGALFKRLHLDPNGQYSEGIQKIATAAAAVARPKALYRVVYVEGRTPNTVVLNGITFTSQVLAANLAGVERVFAYVATCGTEMDDVPVPPDDFIGRYARDIVKEMALGAAVQFLHGHLRHRYGLARTAAMHPGSGDRQVWPIEEQRPLFALLGDVKGEIGVTLTDTFLMHPNKSVSGVLYPTTVDFQTCQLCHREKCPGRTAPFDEKLWRERMETPA
ncbi:MAG: vitamin B12 dependent-methionine synthase activation domain-containing protein [Armatimonadota bacterium]|nr:vitamin B12 dependent-methionine synthase activation domain-containing protein [Armatimonadota bacterium]